LGDQLNAQRFHDFILLQGILPPALIREAVMDYFVPGEKNKNAEHGPGFLKQKFIYIGFRLCSVNRISIREVKNRG
jgi:hypothetical protein